MGFNAERVPQGGPADDIASNTPATGVSYEWPLPSLAPHDRHYSFLSFADHAVWEAELPGDKIALNGEEADFASQ